MFKTYYRLTKPGIIYGNILSTLGGFLLACKWHVNVALLVATIVGTALVIASGCVFNNYIDRGIDKRMARTKKRALVSGEVSGRAALTYATALGFVGFLVLAVYVNWLTVAVGAVGFVDYVVLYGIGKRRSVLGTVIGSVSGATPVLAGYTAVTNHLDAGAVIIFLILVLWQMPHFYAIAMYRRDDYASAGLPVLPVVKGMHAAKVQVMAYIVALTGAFVALTLKGYTGYIFLVVMVGLNFMWFFKGVQLWNAGDDVRWGKKMFLFSLTVIMGISIMLALGAVLP